MFKEAYKFHLLKCGRQYVISMDPFT